MDQILSVFTPFLLQASHLEEKIKTGRESTGSLYLPPRHQEPPTRNQGGTNRASGQMLTLKAPTQAPKEMGDGEVVGQWLSFLHTF